MHRDLYKKIPLHQKLYVVTIQNNTRLPNPLNNSTYLGLDTLIMKKLTNSFIVASFCLVFGIAPTLAQISEEPIKENAINKGSEFTKAQRDSIALRTANMAHLKKIKSSKKSSSVLTKKQQDSIALREANAAYLKKESKQYIAANNPMYQAISKKDTMEYRIDRTFTKEQLTKLVLEVNKKHTAILSYSDVAYNETNEIISLQLELIDSRMRESSYRVVPGSYMNPIRIYEYPDGRSGIKPIQSNNAEEPIPAAVLERMAAQKEAEKERERLRLERQNKPILSQGTSKQPKIIVRSSSTIPDSILPANQKQLRINNLN